jgi:hypothetical protein
MRTPRHWFILLVLALALVPGTGQAQSSYPEDRAEMTRRLAAIAACLGREPVDIGPAYDDAGGMSGFAWVTTPRGHFRVDFQRGVGYSLMLPEPDFGAESQPEPLTLERRATEEQFAFDAVRCFYQAVPLRP